MQKEQGKIIEYEDVLNKVIERGLERITHDPTNQTNNTEKTMSLSDFVSSKNLVDTNTYLKLRKACINFEKSSASMIFVNVEQMVG